MGSTNALRQIGLLIGLAASVAIGAAIVLWLWIPGSDNYFSGQEYVGLSEDNSYRGIPDHRSQQSVQLEYRGNDNNEKLLSLSGAQLDYTQKLEASYTHRIERLLEPLLGAESIRAQVTADIDFTAQEQTLETYNPDSLILRNNELEEHIEDQKDGDKSAGTNKLRREVNSYELDKTISRTQSAIGRINKLSIAVIVDDKLTRGVKGNTIRTPHTRDELEKFTDLVKKSVGFNAKRGDIVNVMGASFKMHRLVHQMQNNAPTKPTWAQLWVKDLFNKTLGTLLVLLLIFAVIRPATKSLASLPANLGENSARYNGSPDDVRINPGTGMLETDDPGDYEKNMLTAARVVDRDPKLVAQIMKNWVSADGA